MEANLNAPLDELLATFQRDGFLVLPAALPLEQTKELRTAVEQVFLIPNEEAANFEMHDSWRPRMFEHGRIFEELIDCNGIIDLIDAILGSDSHLIAMSAMSTIAGAEVLTWHVDETVRFPRPRDVILNSAVVIPCFVVNVGYYLCDVDEDLGPTQFVPGSQRSGRSPEAADFDCDGNPLFEGRGVVSATGQMGTAVLWNDQVWHRGGPHRAGKEQRRLVQQASYGRRFIAQRFYPFINYRLPETILTRANQRRKRLLGLHAQGAYG